MSSVQRHHDLRRPHPGPAAARVRRQGPVHQGDRGGAAGGRDRSRRAFHEGHADGAAGGPHRSPLSAARGCARRLHQHQGAVACRAAAGRGRRHLVAAARRRRCCGCGPTCAWSISAATSRRGCASSRRARPTRRCSRCAGLDAPRPGRRITVAPADRGDAAGGGARRDRRRPAAAMTPRPRALLGRSTTRTSATAVTCERAFLARLDGSCKTPIAGLAELADGILRFRGMILTPDGSEWHDIELTGAAGELRASAPMPAKSCCARAGPEFHRKPCLMRVLVTGLSPMPAARRNCWRRAAMRRCLRRCSTIEFDRDVPLQLDGRASPARHQPQCAAGACLASRSCRGAHACRCSPWARPPRARRRRSALPMSPSGPEPGRACQVDRRASSSLSAAPLVHLVRRDARLRPEIGAGGAGLHCAPAGALSGGPGGRAPGRGLEPAQGRQARRRHPHVAAHRQDLRRLARPAGRGNASQASCLLLPVRGGSRGGDPAWICECAWRRARARKMSLRS